MAKLEIKAGTTSKLLKVFIQDSSVTTGAGLTGLVFNTASLTAYYIREGDASTTAISLVTATLGTFTSSGFIVVDATNMPGLYEIGIPNAAIAAGAKSVVVYLKGASSMAQTVLEIELTAWDNQDAVHGGLSCLPNTAVTTNASLLTSGTGTDQISVATGRIDVGKILGTTSVGAAGYMGLDWGQITNKTTTNALTNTTISSSSAPTAAQVATAVWQDTTAGDFTIASSIGKSLYTTGVVPGGSGGIQIAGSNAATTYATLTSTGAFTINGVSNVSQTGDSFARIGATGSGLTSLAPSTLLTTAMTESYAALHAAPTLTQAIFEIRAILAENSVSSTTVTAKKIDGSTTAETFTINSSTAPTSITRAS